MTKVESGQLKRHDLQEAYRAKYPDGCGKPNSGLTARREAENASSKEYNVTEAKITLILSQNSDWFEYLEPKLFATKRKRWFDGEPSNKFRTYAQLPVVVPTTRQARRIDVLAVENHRSSRSGTPLSRD
ncbi:hypothetical protein AAG897_01950 [Lacticaseibacillus rhamnosus]|uniref:hypothetical protein n=1 Tax=Lacticaseibacillus rhamnosus TaxID=47715 RepID=UPI00189FA024|nr:hypothetical protein [Lacticaseibacillus rhamnosus]